MEPLEVLKLLGLATLGFIVGYVFGIIRGMIWK